MGANVQLPYSVVGCRKNAGKNESTEQFGKTRLKKSAEKTENARCYPSIGVCNSS